MNTKEKKQKRYLDRMLNRMDKAHNQFDADKNQYISDKHMEDLTKVYSPTGGKKTFNNSPFRSKKRSGGWLTKDEN